VLGVQIQPRNRLGRSHRDRQLQLCVPLVTLKGDNYRLKDRDLGRVPTAATDDT
jgi:hypothetical protein